MQILTQLVFSGIALGMIYAVIAFGYQLTFATSDPLNFGQGDARMLGAMVGLSLVGLGVNYWLMIPIVCVFGALQGAFVERIGVQPAIKIKSEFGWIMSTIALGIIFKNVAENLWGRDDLKFPSPMPEAPLHFMGANVLPMEILVIIGAVGMMLAVEFFNRKTIYGKAVVATFNDRDAAKLMGINTGLVITFSCASWKCCKPIGPLSGCVPPACRAKAPQQARKTPACPCSLKRRWHLERRSHDQTLASCPRAGCNGPGH